MRFTTPRQPNHRSLSEACLQAEPRRLDPSPHLGDPLRHAGDPTPSDSPVELLPTGAVQREAGQVPTGSASRPRRAERGFDCLDVPGRSESRSTASTGAGHPRCTAGSGHAFNEPFLGGTTASKTQRARFGHTMTDAVGIAGGVVAAGGRADATGTSCRCRCSAHSRIHGAGMSDTSSPETAETRTPSRVLSDPHDPLRARRPGRDFSTRVGAGPDGRCDVSSAGRRARTDVSSASRGPHRRRLVPRHRSARPLVHQEDGTGGQTGRHESFRGTFRGSIVPGRRTPRSSRFDVTIRARLREDVRAKAHGAGMTSSPRTRRCSSSRPHGRGVLDGSISVGGAGFPASFLSG